MVFFFFLSNAFRELCRVLGDLRLDAAGADEEAVLDGEAREGWCADGGLDGGGGVEHGEVGPSLVLAWQTQADCSSSGGADGGEEDLAVMWFGGLP